MICKSLSSASLILSKSGFILTMWYVNEALVEYAQKNHVSFILTMWYVNTNVISTIKGTTKSFILTMWYVNYKIGDLWVQGSTGFILTMWYVNMLFIAFFGFLPLSFYINYVICKSP